MLALAAFAFLYALILLGGLGQFAFIGPDEPRYAQVAREMFARGDYVSPHLCGLLWFEKPALFYWAAAACYHLFGANEFAARLPSALGALATVAFVGWALWRSQSPRLGLLAGVILATSLIWIGFAHAATTDMLLSATTAIALLLFFLATTSQGRERMLFLLAGAAFTGLAMIAKGLIGVFLVVVILAAHSIWTRRFLFRNWREVLGALVVFALVSSTWYVPVTLTNGRVFIDEFFVNHHFKRYLSNKYNHPQPPYFYLEILIGGALPWSFFLIPAAWRLRDLRPREGSRDSLLALCWIWLVVTVGFFSFSTSKLPGYILPVFPALAIILAVEAERLWQGENEQLPRVLQRIASVLNALSLLIISVAALFYLKKKNIELPMADLALCALPALLGLGVVAAVASGRARASIAGASVAMLGVGVTATLLLSKIGDVLGDKPYSVAVARALKPGESLVFYKRKKQYSHTFYSNGRVKFYFAGRPIQGMSTGDNLGIESADDLARALDDMPRAGPSLVLLTGTEQEAALKKDARFASQVVARDEDEGAVALRVDLR